MDEIMVPSTPWYESNLLWVPLSTGIGILLTVVAAMKHDLRWLLWIGGLCFSVAGWRIFAHFRSAAWRRTLTGISIVFVFGGLYWMGVWLRPTEENKQPTRTTSEQSTQTTPQSSAPPPAPSVSQSQPQTAEPTKPTKHHPKAAATPVEPKVPAPSQNNSGGINSQGSQNCPNGICIGGDNSGNPTVTNNFAPPQRRLTPDQHNGLASCLHRAAASSVFIAYAQHNFEAQTYSDDFVSALTEGGWTPKNYPVPYTEIRTGSGVQVQVANLENPPPMAIALAQCLLDSHIKTYRGVSSLVASGDVLLYVGVTEGSN
jgi:hypothetical protein